MQNLNPEQTVSDILQIIEAIAPPEIAAEWDHIGLQIGDPDQIVNHVLLTLDLNEAALTMAEDGDCELIICHHPLIFTPLPTLCDDVPEQRLILRLIRSGISVIVAHTNLDAAVGGVADCLADSLGLDAAGRQLCGPFGRAGLLAEPIQLSQLRSVVQQALQSAGCRLNTDQDRLISRLAVMPGSFDEDEIPLLEALAVDAVVSGEIKHHAGLLLAARGIAALDAGHDVTERVVLRPLATRLAEQLPQISFAVNSGMDYNKMAF